MKTKYHLWNELVTANPALSAFAPDADATTPRTIDLERELGVNPTFFAAHVKRSLDHIGGHAGNSWLNGLLGGDPGFVLEAFAYGALAERQIRFIPNASVPSTDLFRSSTGETVLDGLFPLVDIYFDIKSLSRPSGILESLLDAVNAEINPLNRVVRASGSLDCDHHELDGVAFATAKNAIVAASANNQPYVHPGLGNAFRFSDANAPIQLSEGVFNPYRFAQENRHLIITNAKQVHRNSRFMFVFVYTELDHEMAAFPQYAADGERALARRAFIELNHAAGLATQYCPKADQAVTVQQVVQALGGLMFLCVHQRTSKLTLRCYLNPNSNAAQEVSRGHVEQLTDFDLTRLDRLEDFAFDNY